VLINYWVEMADLPNLRQGGPQDIRNLAFVSQKDSIINETVNSVHPRNGIFPNSSQEDAFVHEMSTLREENEHLRMYVSKCEQVIKAYQLENPDLARHLSNNSALSDQDSDNSEENSSDLPPWITNSKFMSPLLIAYEQRIQDLVDKNNEMQAALLVYKTETESLVARNKQTETELQQYVKQLLAQMERGNKSQDGTSSISNAGPLIEELKDLQETVALYKEQLEIVRVSEAEARRELAQMPDRVALQKRADQLAQTVQLLQKNSSTSISQLQTARQQELLQLQQARIQEIEEIKNAHEEDWRKSQQQQIDLERQLEVLKQINANLNEELVHTKNKSAQLDIVNDKLVEKSHSLKQAQQKIADLCAKLASSEKMLKDSDQRQIELMNEIDSNQRDMEGMVKSIEGIEKSLAYSKAREAESNRKEDVAKARARDLELDRDQTLQRNDILAKEVDRLKDKLKHLADDMKSASEIDMSKMYKRCKDKEAKLLIELKAFEIETGELKAINSKLTNQLASLQELHDKSVQISEDAKVNYHNELHNMRGKELASEQARQLAESKAERCINELKQVKKEFGSETELFQKQIKELNESQFDLQRSHVILSTERQQLETTLANLTRDHESTLRQKADVIKGLTEQLQNVGMARNRETEALQLRLDESYKTLVESETRASSLLKAQEEMGNKWKEQQQQIINQLQKQLKEKQMEYTNIEKKASFLEKKVSVLMDERDQAMGFASQQEQSHVLLVQQVVELERRLGDSHDQLSKALSREAELMVENKELLSSLDQAELALQQKVRSHSNLMRKLDLQMQYDKVKAASPVADTLHDNCKLAVAATVASSSSDHAKSISTASAVNQLIALLPVSSLTPSYKQALPTTSI
jgi:hypothetical protein